MWRKCGGNVADTHDPAEEEENSGAEEEDRIDRLVKFCHSFIFFLNVFFIIIGCAFSE